MKNISILNFENNKPKIDKTVFIADGVRIIGDVSIGKNSSIWYNAVLRGDDNKIIIGKNSNIQDNSVLHLSKKYGISIGENVSIGHLAIIHGSTIEDNVIIGMGSTILNNSIIGKNSIIGANSLVTQNKIIPEGSLVIGSPARVIRKLTDKEIESIKENANKYVIKSRKYKLSGNDENY